MAAQVKLGDWISKGFELYKQNLGVLLVASLIAWLLTMVSCGILAGPMMAGLILIALDLVDRKEPKPDVGRLFKGFEFFLQSFLFILVWGLLIFIGSMLLNFIICVGTIVAVLGCLALSTLLMFGLFLVVDRRMAFWPASMESLRGVKAQFWPFLGFYIVATVLGSIGAVLCGIGAFLTWPITVCAMAVAYRESFGAPAESQPQAAPPPVAP